MSKLIFASVISEIQQSDIFMTVRARICETPAANLNGARITEAFIDEIVGNEKYVGLPLNADVKALTSGKYNRLGHLYDAKTGEFHSTQIGSFYKFEKESFEGGCYLVGYARIPKRNRKLSKAISELFADGALKFSFELSVGEYEELDDETILIDASENNFLEGTAIVTFPACEDAVALELVAQKADDVEGGEKEMADVENPVEETVETASVEEVASEQTEEAQVETEEIQAEQTEENESSEEEETAACKEKKENAEEVETAAVVVREDHCESHATHAIDLESGVEVHQYVNVETETIERVDGTIVQATDGVHVAETEVAAKEDDAGNVSAIETQESPVENPVETPVVNPENPSNPENPAQPENPENPENPDTPGETVTSEQKTPEELIAELSMVVENLKNEIAELKTSKETVTAEINPFTSELNANGKYSLLQKEEAHKHYSLLEKA